MNVFYLFLTTIFCDISIPLTEIARDFLFVCYVYINNSEQPIEELQDFKVNLIREAGIYKHGLELLIKQHYSEHATLKDFF